MKHYYSPLLLFAVFLIGTLSLQAQSPSDPVGINVRKGTEMLHVKGGVRITSLPRPGISGTIYTKTDGTASSSRDQQLNPSDTRRVVISDGHGVLGSAYGVKPLFFHMPCIVLPLETANAAYNSVTGYFSIDLYQRYVDQFTYPMPPSLPGASSPSAGTLPVEQALDLEYYITYYDPAVFSSVSIDNLGVLKYKVLPGAEATEQTYMDVIFKLK